MIRARGRAIEAFRPQAGASRKGNIAFIVPLDPALEAGLSGHLPATRSVSGADPLLAEQLLLLPNLNNNLYNPPRPPVGPYQTELPC
jgi:hypothetical protein